MSFSNILVPVDGSEGALDAVRFAGSIAKRSGATITLLHVYNLGAMAMLGLAALSREELENIVNRVSEDHFEQAKKALNGLDVDVITAVEIGTPAEEIITMAKKDDFDMIIMGTRGMTQFKGLVVGSVSTHVLHHAPCPVTVVR